MKKILLAFLITAISWAGEVQLNQITNSNALHGLPAGANSYTGTYASVAAVTNQWCGDHYYATDIGQEFIYQCSTPVPNGTPAYGSGIWVPIAHIRSLYYNSDANKYPHLDTIPNRNMVNLYAHLHADKHSNSYRNVFHSHA